ncbi:multiple inositol-polyphosphate phosphatase [Apostasia shenzhenica]|uniref:Multiple inositol polyphosphate phosphatase 1 n=1 Tax=Apostasia shenzhenica TaxID=1088818 RepID=A0A2I0AIF0_9ASPA|nr:multiple inositol-polyphosphate phosphatase [Apostasia shenzhenica]
MASMKVPVSALLIPLLANFFLLASLSAFSCAAAASGDASESFDVRQHLSTVTRYGAAQEANIGFYVSSAMPEGCAPIHLNLVSRHGTRAPTKKRIKELDQLSIHLEEILNHAKIEGNVRLDKIPSWLFGWQSPWKGRQKGGELISKGEDELYHLAIRVRERFPELFNVEYHPEVFNIRATQVHRASASAVAFGMGLFSGNGTLGPGKHRAFSVISESRASDICLRFYDTCETYKEYRKVHEPAVDKLKEPILDNILSKLVQRYQLNFTRQDVASLWFLCKQEASLLDITDQGCGLFTAAEVALLEWTDDLELFILKGYGNSVNYRMGVPLLQDVIQAMEQAILAKEENLKPGTFERARLRFAHAETVVPFTCLLGLLLEKPEYEQIQREEPLDQPPKPPQPRNWRGSIVAPFGGNNMLVLFHCAGKDSHDKVESEYYKNKFFVQVLHNEIPVPMPGCNNSDFCPFETFKERIVNPHLKHNFESVCTLQPEASKCVREELPSVARCSILCKLLNSIRGLFQSNPEVNARSIKYEL